MNLAQLVEQLFEQVHKIATQHDSQIAKDVEGLWAEAKKLVGVPAAPASPASPAVPAAPVAATPPDPAPVAATPEVAPAPAAPAAEVK